MVSLALPMPKRETNLIIFIKIQIQRVNVINVIQNIGKIDIRFSWMWGSSEDLEEVNLNRYIEQYLLLGVDRHNVCELCFLIPAFHPLLYFLKRNEAVWDGEECLHPMFRS